MKEVKTSLGDASSEDEGVDIPIEELLNKEAAYRLLEPLKQNHIGAGP